MLKTVVTRETQLMKNCYGLSRLLRKQFSTENEKKPSYIHRLGSKPLKYVNIGQLLKEAATNYPDRIALVSCVENSRISFAETLDKADRLAAGLLNLGLVKGDRVAIWAANYEFWFLSKMALARAGLICVAMNPAYQLSELDYCLKKVDVKAIIMPEVFRTQKYYEMIEALIPNLKNSSHHINDNKVNSLRNVIVATDNKLPGTIRFDEVFKLASESECAKIENLQPSISPDSGCNIQFTSGTTGLPKAAMVSHLSLVNNGRNCSERLKLDKAAITICSNLPFFHVAGVLSIMNCLNFGSTLVLPSPHFDSERALNAIIKEKCGVVYGTPNMYVDMVTKQKKLQLNLPEIPLSIVGAAICTPKLVKDVKKYLNIKNFTSMYGMTETSACGFQSMHGEDENLVLDHVGCISDHLEAKIVDKDGNAVPFGQPGELYIRGYCTMLGYWKDEEKTKEVIDADKWLKTGDQFILYENGYAKIIGRLKEMIIRGGENLFPREIEDFLNTHPNIMETHVIGVPDERMGEEVGAFIRLKDSSKCLTHDDVREFCKGKISHFKVPRYVVVVDKYPRTTSGKVQKMKFLEIFDKEIKKLQ